MQYVGVLSQLLKAIQNKSIGISHVTAKAALPVLRK